MPENYVICAEIYVNVRVRNVTMGGGGIMVYIMIIKMTKQ